MFVGESRFVSVLLYDLGGKAIELPAAAVWIFVKQKEVISVAV